MPTRRFHLSRASLAYYWPSYLAVVLGVLVGSATLTGALLVGESMRGSLRAQALHRLGPITSALVAPAFFDQDLVNRLVSITGARRPICPLVVLKGTVVHVPSGRRAGGVNIYGYEPESLQALLGEAAGSLSRADGGAVVNPALAAELGAAAGDELLLRLEKTQTVPVDTLLGRRDEVTSTVRAKVSRLSLNPELNDLSLRPSSAAPGNVFVPLGLLRRSLKRDKEINAVAAAGGLSLAGLTTAELQSDLRRVARLADFGLRLRVDTAGDEVRLETDRFLLEPAVESAAVAAADAVSAPCRRVLTYLVNDIAIAQGGTTAGRATSSVPYSTATAVDSFAGALLIDGTPAGPLDSAGLFLNEWAADDLGAKVGNRIRLTYYVPRPFARLEEVETTFTLRGIVKMTVLGADPGLTPTYEGITNTKRITDWNPPFPMDMKRIRPKDEAYWDKYKATPKVFVSLETGLKLWAEPDPRYGRLTSIRIGPGPGLDLAVTAKRFEEELLKRLKPEDFGLKFEPVRAQALASAEGSTDFGMLVIGFSSFLIAAAAMLVALLFRLGVERRAAQIGLLQSIGWPRNKVARTLLAEGAIIAAAGTVLGLLAAIGYAWLMLAGLRTWWAAAVNAPFLHLHISGTSLAIGAAASFLIAVLSISGSIRGMTRLPPRALMAGAAQYSDTVTAVSVTQSGRVAAMCLVLAAGLALASPAFDKLPRAPAFFASGALMLAACLAALMRWMRTGRRAVIARPGRSALARLGIRNAARNRGRSLLTAGLIACASFVVVAVGANRHAVDEGDYARTGGTGGFRLIGESTAPLLFDLNRKDGRESLSLAPETAAALASASVISFRLQPGDDASCLNLYQPRKPRILGATPDMIARGGFAFSSRMADSPDEKANPWLLLNRALPDGAVPCIGDANTIQWLLHLGLGENLIISDERGNPLRLRIVAMLAGSVLQGELVIAERDFIRHFPSVSGYRFFLIEAPPDQAGKLTELLERDLSNFGLDLEPTGRRLADYLAVENTYLSAFQTLGGLGLLLGTFGLAAVMLRNLLERRGELALLRALGFRRSSLAGMVFAENMFLLTAGLVAGTVSALLAVAPHLVSTFAIIPWRSLATTLLAVMLAGAGALAAALRVALRAPLLASLRRE